MTTADIVSLISILAAIAGVVFGVVTIVRNRKQDDTQDGKESGAMMTEIGYIKAGIDDIKSKQDEQGRQYVAIVRDLTAVQESAKQAHHRIDGLEERIKAK